GVVTPRKILRQRQELPHAVGNVEIAAFKQIAPANPEQFGDLRVDRKNFGAGKIVDGVVVKIVVTDEKTRLGEQAPRNVGEHIGFGMDDRIHEYAAPRPVHQVGGKVEFISLRIVQKFLRGG